MTVDAVVRQMVHRGAPVVFADTCSILDLMRDPTRDSVKAHDRIAATRLVEALENGNMLSGMVAPQVVLEMAEHADSTAEETARALTDLSAKLQRIDALHRAYGGVGTSNVVHLNSHATRARAIFDRWVAASVESPEPDCVHKRAVARVNQSRAPARKGKDSIKDCLVIETYLEMARVLRQEGLHSTFVFLSSNTTDYRVTGSTMLRPELKHDFSATRIQYASGFGQARHLLGL